MKQNPAVGQRGPFHFLVEHPGVWIPGLYLLASAIGMLDSWSYFRRFDIDIFLYSDVADFLLASFRSPTAWPIVALTQPRRCERVHTSLRERACNRVERSTGP